MSYSVFDTKKVLDVIKYRWIWLAISAILLIPGIVAMFLSIKEYPTHTPLRVGIDFTGGTIIQYSVDKDVPTEEITQIRAKLVDNDIENPVIQVLKPVTTDNSTIKNILSIRTQFSEEGQNESIDKVSEVISQDYPEAQVVQVSSVGPLLGKQLFVNSMIAVGLALLGIIMYLTLRFHLEFAVVAVLALVHDLAFVLGVFSILGLLYGVHIDSLFVTAILTVLGFSVHDTIVVFDRIRENMALTAGQRNVDLKEVVNKSITQTLSRSINTSLTTFIMVFVLFILGVSSIREFAAPLIVGIICGGYSSVCITGALWYTFKTKFAKKK